MSKLELLKAQKTVLVGERAKHSIDLEVLTSNPQSIPEHTKFQEELDLIIGKLAEINDKIELVDFLIQQEEKHG
jgi:hypothetical protein